LLGSDRSAGAASRGLQRGQRYVRRLVQRRHPDLMHLSRLDDAVSAGVYGGQRKHASQDRAGVVQW
jgi:hypothetical protein